LKNEYLISTGCRIAPGDLGSDTAAENDAPVKQADKKKVSAACMQDVRQRQAAERCGKEYGTGKKQTGN